MSEAQRRSAANSARANFTKHLKWFHDDYHVWTALSNNLSYDICRKVRHNSARPSELDIPLCDTWAEDDLGFFLFVIFVARKLPPRPTPFHWLLEIDFDRPLGPDNIRWVYRRPSRKRRFADPQAALADRLFGQNYPGDVMPEDIREKVEAFNGGDPRYAWHVNDILQSLCLCTPRSYFADCECEIALRARYEIEGE